jgi:Secretion system C-terminal sorting domain
VLIKYFRTKEVMKQRSLFLTFFPLFSLTTALSLMISVVYAQEVAGLIFRKPVLENGNVLKGAKYRFPNVTDGVDAIVEIKNPAKYNQQQVYLTWSTEQEKACSHFIVEKSGNGVDFQETAIVFAQDNGAFRKEYSLSHELSENAKGFVYYRLKMVDVNQNTQISGIHVIKIGEDVQQVKVQAYPNPVVNELRITIPSAWQNQPITYYLYSVNGKLVKQVTHKSASQTEVLSMTDVNAGTYIMKVRSGSETAVKQVIKSNDLNYIN